jgi:hypothetical protein
MDEARSDALFRIANYLEAMVPLLEKLVDATVASSSAQIEAMEMVHEQQAAIRDAGLRQV